MRDFWRYFSGIKKSDDTPVESMICDRWEVWSHEWLVDSITIRCVSLDCSIPDFSMRSDKKTNALLSHICELHNAALDSADKS